jgi:coenzyme Q-binding protein COQ10
MFCFSGDCCVQAVASSATPLFETLETTWRFRPALSVHRSNGVTDPGQSRFPSTGAKSIASDHNNVGPTLLSLDLSFAFANPVHAAVSRTFFGKVSTLMVKAFEERCLKVYGRGDGME